MAAKYRRMLGGLLLLTLGVSLGIGGWLLWKAEAPSEKTAKASLTTVREIRGARERPSKPVITKLPLENPRPGVIRVGAVSQFSPPYNCDDNYRDYCIIPEVLERVFTQRGYQAEYQSVSLPREFIELATGRLDAAMVYTNTFLSLDDYPDTVHVCPVPAFHAPISAFARRDRPVELNTAEDMLKHHLVAIRLPGFLRGMLNADDFPEITRANSVRAIMTTLAAGRADYGMYEYHVALYMIDRLKLENTLYWVRDITYLNYHLAFSKRALEARPELLAMCGDIQALRDKGELQAIVSHGRQMMLEHLRPVMQDSFIEQRHPETLLE